MNQFFPNLFLVFSSGVLVSNPAFAVNEVGKVVSSVGNVIARVEGKDLGRKGIPQARTLKSGGVIYRFDVINTGSDSSVKLLFDDQTIMDLGASTLFKVEEFSNREKPGSRRVELNLAYGRIRAAINQKVGKEGKFKLKTHVAIMGVRGTEFYVNAGSADLSPTSGTELVVTEGKVDAVKLDPAGIPSKPISVNPGEKYTVTTESQPDQSRSASSPNRPIVEKITPAEIKSVVTATKIVDQTFSQAIKIDPPAKSDASPGLPLGVQGAETLAAIKETILSKSDLNAPPVNPSKFSIPGVPLVQPNFSGNFLPGFSTKFVTLHVRIHP